MMGGTIVAGLTAFQLLKKQSLSSEVKDLYKTSMRLGLTLMLIFGALTVAWGDMQMKYLVKEQPMKFAAAEGVVTTTGKHAPWTIVGVYDTKTHESKGNLDIPYVLSILTYDKTSGSVKGMKEINAQLEKKYGTKIDNQKISYYPPVNTVFYSFRIMAAVGGWMMLVSIVGLFLSRKKAETLYKHKWTLWVVALTTFVPFIGNTAGWFVTEFGRFPWTVYGLFTIQQSVSPNVSVASLLTSNIVYFLLFTSLAIVMIYLVVRQLRKDPMSMDQPQFAEKILDPFDKGAF